jgi:hypothetical protein
MNGFAGKRGSKYHVAALLELLNIVMMTSGLVANCKLNQETYVVGLLFVDFGNESTHNFVYGDQQLIFVVNVLRSPRHKSHSSFDKNDESSCLTDAIEDDIILDEAFTENSDADMVIRLDEHTVNQRETDILKAAKHVEEAINMREYCNWMIEQCKATQQNTNNERTITLNADYSQNGELPSYGNQQPGETYYYSPLTLNIFGIVDTDDKKETMVAYCYEEFEGRKGGNNVASLLMLHLHEKQFLNKNDPIGTLNIIMDNCCCQNKNKMVLRLANYLVEMGYFKEVNFCFLVVGHTKNHADRLFNLAKSSIRSSNVYCMKDFICLIGKNEHIQAVHVHSDQFFEWGTYLDELYYNFDKPGVKKWQLFQCSLDI